MPEIHLKQPGSTYSACGPFTKNIERIQKFKETGDTTYISKTELFFFEFFFFKKQIVLNIQSITMTEINKYI